MPPAVATTRSSTGPPSPWFEGAPITKLCCMLWAVGHVTLPSNSSARMNPLLSSLLFSSTGEVIMGAMFLAQQFKQLERELSSRQLIVFMVWTSLVANGITWLTQQTIDPEDFSFASGPYPWMGGILFWYWRYVPRLYPRFASVLGISLSEKALQYIWVLYLMGSQGWKSLPLGLFGFVASALYFFLVPKYLPLTIPEVVVTLLPWESLGGLLFLDPPPKVYVPMMMAAMMNQNIMPGGGGRRQAPTRAAPAMAPPRPIEPPPPPSQEAIEQLTAMGFDEERVKQALQQSQNNVERAANLLLMG